MAKKWKTERLNRYLDVDSFNGSIEEVISKLEEWKSFHEAEGYRNITIKAEQVWDSCEVDLFGERLETDKEETARLKRNAKAKAAAKKKKEKKEEKELKELERLKKKYEGKTK